MKSESTIEITKALIFFQTNLKPVSKDSTNPFFKSKYASISAIWECIRKPLGENGLAVSQLPRIQDNNIVLTTLLLHTSGEWLCSDLLVTPGKQNDAQSVGSALTYARRYALSAILGICSEEDDDAEATKREKPITKPSVPPPIREAPAKPAEKKPDPVVEAAKEMGATEAIPEFANAGDFLMQAYKAFNLTKTQVLKLLEEDDIATVKDLQGAWVVLRTVKEGK